jgi:stearoyl-CoA desaturase (delta-9 desaturase)
VDISYYVLSLLSWFGIVWDLRTPPEHIKARTIAVENASYIGRTPPAHNPEPS